MRVVTSVLIALLTFAPTTKAQTPTPHGVPNAHAPRDPLPRFTIAPRGAPLGQVGLPLPQIGLQPQARAHERGRRPRPRGTYFPWPMMVFYLPQPIAAPVSPPEPTPVVESPAAGRLILDIQPPTAQVFADGYYIGVPGDFSAGRGGGLFETGPHRIDVSAAGYEPMTMDVRITAGQPATIRGELKALPPVVVVPPTTFYLIPGCYMGNIPPKEAHLPATCDPSRAISWLP